MNATTPKLPFSPSEVHVADLHRTLANVTSPEVIVALRDADPRSTATPHYERRLDEVLAAVRTVERPAPEPRDESIIGYAIPNPAIAAASIRVGRFERIPVTADNREELEARTIEFAGRRLSLFTIAEGE